MSETAGEAPRKKARARGKPKGTTNTTNNAAEADVGAPANGEDSTPAETLEEAAERLAGLTKGRYEQLRAAEAARLNARVSALDRLVNAARDRVKADAAVAAEAEAHSAANGEVQPDEIEAQGGPPRGASKEEVIKWLAGLPPLERHPLLKAAKSRLGITKIKVIDDAVKGVIDKRQEEEVGRARAARAAQQFPGFSVAGGALPGTRPKATPDPDGVIWPPGFTMRKDGLWHQPTPRKDGSEPDRIWIAASFQIVAQTSDDSDHSHGLLLRWHSRTGHPHEWAMPQSMAHADGNAIAEQLQDAGLPCGTSRLAHEALKTFLGAVEVTHHVRCVDHAGWYGGAFLYPTGRRVIGPGHNSIVLQSEQAVRDKAFSGCGTLAEWQKHVAKPAIGNSRLILAISHSLAPPLYDLTNDTSCGVHLHGDSQSGKTTATCAYASVWGDGAVKGDQIRSWRSTSNGMEAVASQYNDLSLPLEEIGQSNARDVGDVVYMLGNMRGKARMHRGGGALRQRSFRVGYFSTGEITLAAKMDEGGLRVHAGQEVRLLNVPADAGAGLGTFENLHGAASGGAFSDQVRRSAATYYGTAGLAFLERLVEEREKDAEKLTDKLRAGCDLFLRVNCPGADGQVRSAAMRFALIGMAGELARIYGVVPWPKGEAVQAAATCFKAWLTARGTEGAAEDREALKRLVLFLELHAKSRFQDLDWEEAEEARAATAGTIPNRQRIIDRAGYVKEIAGERLFFILPEVWRTEIMKGMDHERAARAIRALGFLIPDADGKHVRQKAPVREDGYPRAFAIQASILDGRAVP